MLKLINRSSRNRGLAPYLSPHKPANSDLSARRNKLTRAAPVGLRNLRARYSSSSSDQPQVLTTAPTENPAEWLDQAKESLIWYGRDLMRGVEDSWSNVRRYENIIKFEADSERYSDRLCDRCISELSKITYASFTEAAPSSPLQVNKYLELNCPTISFLFLKNGRIVPRELYNTFKSLFSSNSDMSRNIFDSLKQQMLTQLTALSKLPISETIKIAASVSPSSTLALAILSQALSKLKLPADQIAYSLELVLSLKLGLPNTSLESIPSLFPRLPKTRREIVAQNWAMYMAREGKVKEFWDQFKLLLDAYDMDEDPNAEREKDRLVQILAPYTAGLSQAFPLSKEQQTLWTYGNSVTVAMLELLYSNPARAATFLAESDVHDSAMFNVKEEFDKTSVTPQTFSGKANDLLQSLNTKASKNQPLLPESPTVLTNVKFGATGAIQAKLNSAFHPCVLPRALVNTPFIVAHSYLPEYSSLTRTQNFIASCWPIVYAYHQSLRVINPALADEESWDELIAYMILSHRTYPNFGFHKHFEMALPQVADTVVASLERRLSLGMQMHPAAESILGILLTTDARMDPEMLQNGIRYLESALSSNKSIYIGDISCYYSLSVAYSILNQPQKALENFYHLYRKLSDGVSALSMFHLVSDAMKANVPLDMLEAILGIQQVSNAKMSVFNAQPTRPSGDAETYVASLVEASFRIGKSHLTRALLERTLDAFPNSELLQTLDKKTAVAAPYHVQGLQPEMALENTDIDYKHIAVSNM